MSFATPLTRIFYTNKNKNGQWDKENFVNQDNVILFTVWSQPKWNEEHHNEQFNLPTASMVFENLTDGKDGKQFDIIIAHDKLDRIDMSIAISMVNTLNHPFQCYDLIKDWDITE